MYHSFLIHSSVDGHLGCFHVRAIVNSAAMKSVFLLCLDVLHTFLGPVLLTLYSDKDDIKDPSSHKRTENSWLYSKPNYPPNFNK